MAPSSADEPSAFQCSRFHTSRRGAEGACSLPENNLPASSASPRTPRRANSTASTSSKPMPSCQKVGREFGEIILQDHIDRGAEKRPVEPPVPPRMSITITLAELSKSNTVSVT